MKKEKTAVVTGGSRGIGFEISKRLIEEGYKAAICARTKKEIEKAVGELGRNCFGVVCDVSNIKDIARFFSDVKKKFGKVDVLVNNAGVIVWKDFSEHSYDEISWQVEVNLTGVMFVTKAFLPLIKSGGVVVNIASGAGKFGHGGLTPYSATKFGVRGFSQALAKELKNVKVYSINPHAVATRMTGFRGVSPEKVAQVVLNAINGKYKVESGGDVDVWKYI